MMHGFYAILSAETASFRDPGGQLYHATLPLPPVSTLIGIAGAALGLEFRNVWEFFKSHDIAVGVRGKAFGQGLDLWKYQKIVTKEVRHDIIKREFMFRPTYTLYYGSEDKEALEQLRQAFLDPAWALSLGTSDDIVCIKKISPVEYIAVVEGETTNLTNSLVPGNQTDHFSFNWESIAATSIPQSLKLPIVRQLPVDFTFSTDGERKACRYKPFTFLTATHCLKAFHPVYVFGEEIIALISIAKE